MKLRSLASIVIAAILVFSLYACSGAGGAGETTMSPEEEQAQLDKMAAEAEEVPQPESQPAVEATAAAPGESTTETAAEVTETTEAAEATADAPTAADGAADTDEASKPETVAGIDKILGEWVDVNDVNRSVTITKSGDTYRYKDSDGTYPGTVQDGVLVIKISDQENDTAKVFIDAKSKNLITDYQGDIYEFTRLAK